MRYLFLRIYGNDELCAYLTNMLERGWIIDHGRGNFLFFRKQRLPDARLAVVSTECTKRLPTDDEQVDESIGIAHLLVVRTASPVFLYTGSSGKAAGSR